MRTPHDKLFVFIYLLRFSLCQFVPGPLNGNESCTSNIGSVSLPLGLIHYNSLPHFSQFGIPPRLQQVEPNVFVCHFSGFAPVY